MEIKYINNVEIQTCGTCGKGSFTCDYDTLINGTVTTIYDWKQGKRYLGEEEGIEVQEVIEWNVGGNHPINSIEHLKDFFISKGYGISNVTGRHFVVSQENKR